MKNRIITISRQFASGGRIIGKKLSGVLGIPCYDEQIVDKVGEESGFSGDYISEQGEYAEHSALWLSSLANRDFLGQSNQNYIWNLQCKLIHEIAGKGPCIIVGRCADYILQDAADCMKVFIHADMQARIEYINSISQNAVENPEKLIQEKDKRRAAYYRFYTDREWGVSQNYDLVLNSTTFGIENCVAVIADLYKKFRGV